MKKILLLFTILLGFSMTLLAQTETINDFESSSKIDTVYWNLEISDAADPDSGYANRTLSAEAAVGDSSMRVEYGVHRTEGWGGYTKIEHFHPDTNSVYNWSAYDSISFMYYVDTPQSIASSVELRFCLYDVSENGPTTYDVAESEYYYSFHKVLDATPGWNKIKMPLTWDPNNWDGQGFMLTDWTGIWGNTTLDKDQIKGYAFELSIGGAGDPAPRDISEGVVLLDEIALENPGKVEVIFFNGRDFQSNVTPSVWGNSGYEVVEGAGYTPETNAVKWSVAGDWQGMVMALDDPVNMSFVWGTDSLKFKAKVPAGTGPFRVWFEDDNETVGKSFYSFDPAVWNWDGEWKIVELSLNKDLVIPDPNPVDSSSIKSLVFMTEEGFGEATDIYFDDIWTGNPELDIIPPGPPTNITYSPSSEFYNVVGWQDVADETGEKYYVYASLNPITDVEAEGVDLVQANITESEAGGNSAIHYLYSPMTDQNTFYYYAVVCKDAAGNVGEPGTSPGGSNLARGVPPVSMVTPPNFAADGDLSEWSEHTPFILNPTVAFVPASSVDFTGDEDLNAMVYVAIDSDYIYIAVDAIDDVFEFGSGNWWEQDAFELFIGFYPFTGKKHKSLKRGVEPDYKFVITKNNVNLDVAGGAIIHEDTSAADFYYEDFSGTDFLFETRISLDSIAAIVDGDARFTPTEGDRITLTITLHDNDGAGWEGNLGLSPLDKDNAYQTPEVWIYTWLGEDFEWTTVEDDASMVAETYELKYNYPNPFNPTTTIVYTIPTNSDVKVEIFNVLGQKVMTLVDGKQLAGEHKATFNAKNLSSGIYFYRLKAGSFSQTRKMMLVK